MEKRLIDANDIVKVAEHAYNEWSLAMAAADGNRQINKVFKMQELCKTVEAVAKAAPTVDPVHAAGGCYCRECKNFGEDTEYGKSWCSRPFGCYGCLPVKPDDFCSYGERGTVGHE